MRPSSYKKDFENTKERKKILIMVDTYQSSCPTLRLLHRRVGCVTSPNGADKESESRTRLEAL